MEIISMKNSQIYVTTEELSDLIRYDVRTIHERLKDSVLFECIHYISLFQCRKILYDWEAIKRDMFEFSPSSVGIPLASGGINYGTY
jgi:hypothetical protein